MGKIQDLPVEVFLNIVREGCNEETRDPPHNTWPYQSMHPRALKRFVALVRKVCRHWRKGVDRAGVLPAYLWFWAATLAFDIDARDLGRRDLGEGYDFPARRLRRLRDILGKSHGCDLICHLSCTITEEPEYRIAVGLLTHALYVLSLHHKQIISLRIEMRGFAGSPAFVYETLKILGLATNLIILGLDASYITLEEHEVGRSNSGIYPSSATYSGGELPPIIQSRAFQTFQNLDSLSVADPAWLEALRFQPRLTSLTKLTLDGGIGPFLEGWSESITSCRHLTHLCLTYLTQVPDEANNIDGVIDPPIILPSLTNLAFDGSGHEPIYKFLKRCSFPQLQVVEVSGYETDTEERAVHLPSAFDPPRLGSLNKLSLSVGTSWYSLQNLDYFSNSDVRILEIGIDFPLTVTDSSPGGSHEDMLTRTLSKYHPETMDVESTTTYWLWCILRGTNMEKLKDLSMRLRYVLKEVEVAQMCFSLQSRRRPSRNLLFGEPFLA